MKPSLTDGYTLTLLGRFSTRKVYPEREVNYPNAFNVSDRYPCFRILISLGIPCKMSRIRIRQCCKNIARPFLSCREWFVLILISGVPCKGIVMSHQCWIFNRFYRDILFCIWLLSTVVLPTPTKWDVSLRHCWATFWNFLMIFFLVLKKNIFGWAVW